MQYNRNPIYCKRIIFHQNLSKNKITALFIFNTN